VTRPYEASQLGRQPQQLLAQRFPTGYIVHGNKGDQTMQAGNAVSCNVAQWVGERVAAALNNTAAHAA
jgi:DNA (cytosine-5)-methyltransferase 1